MSFDIVLAERVRKELGNKKGITEKKMFGGLSFLLHGNMCCGIIGRNLVVRVGPEMYAKSLSERGSRPMDFTGKPLSGFVYVDQGGYPTGAGLAKWVRRGFDFASTLKKKRAR